MADLDIKTFQNLPPVESYRRIDFDSAEVVPGFVNDTYFLIVRGTKPWITMKVELLPLIYTHQPEYWGIEVAATHRGIGLPTQAPYEVVLDISNLRGTKGVEVLGATRLETIDV